MNIVTFTYVMGIGSIVTGIGLILYTVLKSKRYIDLPLSIIMVFAGGMLIYMASGMTIPAEGSVQYLCVHEEHRDVVTSEYMFKGQKVYNYTREKKCLKKAKHIYEDSFLGRYHLAEK